jgi:hypothetical protein
MGRHPRQPPSFKYTVEGLAEIAVLQLDPAVNKIATPSANQNVKDGWNLRPRSPRPAAPVHGSLSGTSPETNSAYPSEIVNVPIRVSERATIDALGGAD